MSSNNHYDAIVFGLGAMGSATLCHLAERGFQVCGIDQHHVPHDFGSSHGSVRVIRKAYFEHPDYIPLLDRAYQLWDDLDSGADHPLFVKNGVILSGSPSSETILGLEQCYAEHDLPHEKLTADEARKRFKPFHTPEDHTLFFDPSGGYLYIEDCIREYLRRAKNASADIRMGEPEPEWKSDRTGVQVKTTNDRYAADRLVLTLGPWSPPFLAHHGIQLEICRKVQVWYGTQGLENSIDDAFPCFATELDQRLFYGFPPLDERGIKVAEHSGGQSVARPEDADREISEEDESPLRDYLKKVFPALEPVVRHYSTCLYTNTRDGHFIIDQHPDYGNVTFAAGLCGHGFKFASVIGEVLADLSLNGKTKLPIEFLRMKRLAAD